MKRKAKSDLKSLTREFAGMDLPSLEKTKTLREEHDDGGRVGNSEWQQNQEFVLFIHLFIYFYLLNLRFY